MSESIKSIADLRTGNPEIDELLEKAYALGHRQGQVAAQDDIRIDVTKRNLSTLMRVQNVPLNTALATLQIPKAQRKTYEKIFSAADRQKKSNISAK